jgi:hypothetical protein
LNADRAPQLKANVMPLDLKMPDEFKSTWWSIEVAPGWFAEREAECVTFWREDGVGALQISAYKYDSGCVPDDDLHDFMKGEFPDDARIQHLSCGEFEGMGVDYVVDGKFWRKRWVRSDPLLIYVTYNSGYSAQAIESAAVDQMLATLKSRCRPAA